MKINSKTIKYSLTLAFLTIAGFYVYHSFAGVFKINRSKANDLTSGLVGYWTFDGADTTSTTVADKSSSARNGTLSGATKPNPIIGKIGQGMNFNGSTSYINVAGFTQWYQLPLSYGAWIKLNATPAGDRYAIYKSGEFYLRIGATSVGCKEDNSGQAETVKTVTLVPGQWYHIFCSLSSGSKKIYINGADSSATVGGFGPSPYGETLKIGGEPDYYGIFNGQMDEVRIYNVALSDSEITELYQQGQTKINSSQTNKLTSGLVVYYTMDGQDTTWTDASSGTVADKSSGGTNTGTLYGMSQSTSPAVGKIGQAFNFNGSNQYVDMGNNLEWSGSLTVSTWHKRTTKDATNADGIVGNWYWNPDANLRRGWTQRYYINTDTVGFYVELTNGSTIEEKQVNYTTGGVGQWYHTVSVFNPSDRTIKLYVDGVLRNTNTGSVGFDQIAYDSSYPMRIGYNPVNSGYFPGFIDEVRIYNRALSDSEITELYQQGQTKINASQVGKLTDGLKHYYTFDGPDMSGDTVYDKVSSGAIDGTLTNCNVYPEKPSRTVGKIGQGLRMASAGEDECIQLSSAITTGTTFAVSLWIKPDYDASGFLFGQGNQNAIRQGGFGRINYIYSSADHFSATNNLISVGNWNHIAVSVNSGTATFYINGVADGTAASVISMNVARIGGAGGQSSFYGSMDEVRVYNRALSASEVKELYNQGR